MNALAASGKGGYDGDALEASGVGRDNPMILGAVALLKALFLRMALFQWRAMQGHRKVCRVPSSRFITPASPATISVIRVVADSNLTRSLT